MAQPGWAYGLFTPPTLPAELVIVVTDGATSGRRTGRSRSYRGRFVTAAAASRGRDARIGGQLQMVRRGMVQSLQ